MNHHEHMRLGSIIRAAGAATLILFASCASGRPRSPSSAQLVDEVEPRPGPAQRAGGNLTNDECKTVLDCMRLRGSPPAGLKWTCHLGLCAAEVAAR